MVINNTYKHVNDTYVNVQSIKYVITYEFGLLDIIKKYSIYYLNYLSVRSLNRIYNDYCFLFDQNSLIENNIPERYRI